MAAAEMLWQPQTERVQTSQMYAFMQSLAERHGFAPGWDSFHRWSVQHSDIFWSEMLKFAAVRPFTPATRTRSGAGMLNTKWFEGLTLNYAAHILRHNDDGTALVSTDERGRLRTLNYRELAREVGRCRAALRAAGVKRGSRVAAYVPNVPEAIVAMLASASLGAIFSSCSPDFGVAGVLDRMGQIEPTVLIAADGYSYTCRPIDTLGKVRQVLDNLSTVRSTVIIPFLRSDPSLAELPGAVLWDDFLSGADDEELTFEPVPFDHPLYIMYSSGTTGVPKCIVHGHGGTLVQHMKELMLHCDLRRDDVIFYFTTCGWMMWNWLVSGLGVGATVVLYEGNPGYPDLGCLWRLAEETRVNVFGTSAKFLAACQKAGITPVREYDLMPLRCVLSTGSPLAVDTFKWVYQSVKSDLQLSSISGGTDIVSCFMLGNPMLAVYAGEIQCLGLGMDVQAYDAQGKAVVEQKGELVCCSPFPSQPVRFWNDPDNSRYRSAYFDYFPGVWRHGDFIEITARGGVIVYGRSDATLNPGGVRIGTAEIYRIVEALEGVTDSIVVGRASGGDEEVCLFVVLRPELELDAQLAGRIRQQIAEKATKRHVPKHIAQVSQIPYTISGKKVELAVAQVLQGEPVLNKDALANPQALDEYHNPAWIT